jgi:hypothetical protein
MLQLLRLPIGTRAVWVDAICINQNDIEERDSQVMKMSQRYKNCFRVVVFLGPDMATSVPASYPAQKELVLSNSKLSTGISPKYFRELLCRRYFSRIWVVQELVLARRVALQIGDSEYWMDSTTMRSLEARNNWDWNSTTAPWLRNIGLERLQETDIFHILRATHMCQCADPRDRVFGILSLLSNNSSDSGLRADYSLSLREMVIGLFSHALLKLRDLRVVRFAAGLHNYSKFPSWMPDLELLAYGVSSEDGLKLSECQSIVGDDEVHHGGTPWYLSTTIDSSTGALSINLIHLLEFQSSPRKTENVGSMNDWHQFIIPGRDASLVLSSNLPLDKLVIPTRDHLFCLNDGIGSPIFLVMSLETDNHTYNLMGICRHVAFQHQRLYLRESIQEWNAGEAFYYTAFTPDDDWGLRVKGRSKDQNLHLRSLKYTLHTQLDAINSDDTSLDLWADDPSGIKSFKQKLGFGHGSDCTLKSILMSLINEHNKDEPGFFACFSHCIPVSLRPQVEVDDLDEYIVVTVTEAPAKVDSRWWHNPDIEWRFVGQTCIESSPKKDCSCRESFNNTPITRYSTRISWEYGSEFPPVGLLSEYASREDGRGSRNVSGHCMLWQKYSAYDNALSFIMGANHQMSWSPREERILWPKGLAVQIRIPTKAIKRRIKQTMAWKTLHRLNRVSPISSEDELDAILGSVNPNPDFCSIAVPGWPTELVDDFNIDGSIQRVSIQ